MFLKNKIIIAEQNGLQRIYKNFMTASVHSGRGPFKQAVVVNYHTWSIHWKLNGVKTISWSLQHIHCVVLG